MQYSPVRSGNAPLERPPYTQRPVPSPARELAELGKDTTYIGLPPRYQVGDAQPEAHSNFVIWVTFASPALACPIGLRCKMKVSEGYFNTRAWSVPHVSPPVGSLLAAESVLQALSDWVH